MGLRHRTMGLTIRLIKPRLNRWEKGTTTGSATGGETERATLAGKFGVMKEGVTVGVDVSGMGGLKSILGSTFEQLFVVCLFVGYLLVSRLWSSVLFSLCLLGSC